MIFVVYPMPRTAYSLPENYHDDAWRECRVCGKALPTFRHKRFCSPECSEEFWGTRNWQMLKMRVHKRDDWTCQICGKRKTYSFSANHADHIIPVADGGDEWDPENIRTLCVPCHKAVTKEWHRERKLRKMEGEHSHWEPALQLGLI